MSNLVKKIGPALCAGLALSAVEAMASTDSAWELESLTQATQVDPASDHGRLGAIGDHVVGGPKASQSMAHAWYRLSERMTLGGEPLLAIYEKEGLGEFIKTQAAGSAGAGACYTACYGNCYGNCYSNCYGNCHGADS
jgi:hypothetical protein